MGLKSLLAANGYGDNEVAAIANINGFDPRLIEYIDKGFQPISQRLIDLLFINTGIPKSDIVDSVKTITSDQSLSITVLNEFQSNQIFRPVALSPVDQVYVTPTIRELPVELCK